MSASLVYPLFAEPTTRVMPLFASGEPPTSYTITVDAGSYLITGFRATLRYSGATTGAFPQVLNVAVMGLS